MLKAGAQTSKRDGRVAARIAIVSGSAVALALAVTRLVGGDGNPVLSEVEWWILDDAAFGFALATPAILAAMALRGRPVLFLPAGILSVLFALSPIVLTLPLAIPAALLFVAFARASPPPAPTRRAPALIVCVVLGAAALAVLLLGPHVTVCWTHRTIAGRPTVFERDLGAEGRSSDGRSSQSIGPPVPGEIESGGGCSGAAVPPITSGAALLFVGASCVAARLVPRTVRS